MLTVSPLVTIDFFDAVYDRCDVLFTQPTMYMSCHKPRGTATDCRRTG